MARILFIASGFPPYEFSENIINGKLVLALLREGHSVYVISKVDDGALYNSEWREPWLSLEPITFTVTYPKESFIRRYYEIFRNTLYFKYPIEGIRWAEFAYRKAESLITEHDFDLIITRSPSDIAHLVGLRIKKNHNIKWIANWNDPSTGIWPAPYEKRLPFLKRIISGKYAQEVLKRADITSFPSQMLSDHFKNHFLIEEQKVRIIPHIMLQSGMTTKQNDDPVNLHMLHSGNLSVERDPVNLLRAIAKFNNLNKEKVFLDILGVVSREASVLIKDSELDGYVRLIKPVPYNEALNIMAEYDVLLIMEAIMETSIFLPSKITDYSQLKKTIFSLSPVISETGNLLKKYGGGLTAQNNSYQDIYDKLSLLSIMKREEKLVELSKNASLNEYLGERYVMNMFDEIIKER
jgi:glycosyltransferase involved in cell wall biosynthesis